jgi:hypothetical protein
MSSVELELDLSTITLNDMEGDGNPPPGKYHARIEDAQCVSDQTSYLKIRLSLLAGTDPNGVGCVFSERFYLSDKAKKRLAILAHRLHLLADNDFGGRVNIDWSQAIGKQLIVQVVEEEYEAKNGNKAKRAKLAFAGFWSLDDERVKDVPRDQTALRQAAVAHRTAPPKNNSKPAGDDWESI